CIPNTTSRLSTTLKWFRTRNSETMRSPTWPSVWPVSDGPTLDPAHFKPSVSASNSATNHLSAGEKFTPHTQYTKPNNETKYDGIYERCTPSKVEGFVVPAAQTHNGHSRHVGRDY